MKKCPYCGANLQDDDNYCVYCGKNVEQEEVKEETFEEHSTNECEYCHKPISSDDKFCKYCGMEVRGRNAGEPHPHDKENSVFKNYLLYWKNTFNFKGRTSRKGYWDAFWITLVLEILLGWICPLIDALNVSYTINNEYLTYFYSSFYEITDPDTLAQLLTYDFNLVTDVIFPALVFIPNLSIAIRRLRDTGKPWYAIFITCVPLVGYIIYVVWLCRPSDYFKYNHR